MRRAAALAVAGAALLSAAPPAAAQAWLRWEQSPRAAAMGGAAAASASGASAAFLDPAGLLALPGTRVEAGAALSASTGEFAEVGGDAVDRAGGWQVDPWLYVVHPIAHGVVGGLAINAPWGASVEWEDPAAFAGRFRARAVGIRGWSVSPVVAWEAPAGIAVAGGLAIASVDVEIDRVEQDPAISAIGGLGPIPLANGEYRMDGLGVGWVAAARWPATPRLSVAGQMRGKIEVEIHGRADFAIVAPESIRPLDVPGTGRTVQSFLDSRFAGGRAITTLVLPANAVAGVEYEVLPGLRAALDVQWTGWGAVDGLDLAIGDSLRAEPIPLDLEDAWSIRLGGEWVDGNGIAWRAGLAREGSPSKGAVSPLLPEGDRTAVSFGIGLPWQGSTLEAAWRASFVEPRAGLAFPGDDAADGTFESVEHRLAIGVTRAL